MGTLADAKCNSCGYAKEKVSFPGRDSGFVVICESMICLDERELVVVTTDYNRAPRSRYWELLKTNPDLESKLGKCPSCKGTNLESWHRQCPKCGEIMSLTLGPTWE